MRLYEKFRPPDLEQVIGHEAAKKQIQCTLRNGWGGKAFWISGPSGTGKTTLARIIAAYGASEMFVQEYDSADVATADVLARIGKKMKGVLKKPDYEPLASSPDNLRWRNTAQWARNSMVNEGLLKKDSPRGIWEISDKGKSYLRQNE